MPRQVPSLRDTILVSLNSMKRERSSPPGEPDESVRIRSERSFLTRHYISVARFIKRMRRHQRQRMHPKVLRQPPILPGRRQPSTVGRLCLNGGVRDGNPCVP